MGQPYPGQPYPGQPYPGQPYPNQPYGPPSYAPPPSKPFPVGLVVGLVLVIPGAVCVLGILAAVAIPAFTRYVKRSKTTEATSNIAAIYRAETAYYNQSAERGVPRFLSAAPTPATPPTAMKYPANLAAWTGDAAWSALGFSVITPHYYQYQVVATGTGANASFTVTAIGDLDGDMRYSTFSRTATVTAGEIVGSPIEITNELE